MSIQCLKPFDRVQQLYMNEQGKCITIIRRVLMNQIDFVLDLVQGFSTSGSRPHLGSPSDFRGVARLSTNLLKNDGIFKY